MLSIDSDFQPGARGYVWSAPAHRIFLRPYMCARSLQAALAAQKAEAEASASRSLQFIDRVMADKDVLSGGSYLSRLP